MTKKKPPPRLEPPRLLHRDSGYVDPCPTCKGKGRVGDEPCGTCDQTGTKDPEQSPGYTANPGSAMPNEPEAVPKEVQEQQSKEGTRRFNETREDEQIDFQARALANKLAKVQRDGAKYGVDLGPALMGLIREHQAEIQRRKQEKAA